ncbi:MAG: class II aldolase/adducin family protein [Candidatus Bathyarchaeia archaeon]
MQLDGLRKELKAISRICGDRGWCPGTSGNISARIPGTDKVLIKITGRSMAEAEDQDFVLIDLEGKALEEVEGRPSKEVNFHLGIYRARSDVEAVLHTHPTFATAQATATGSFPILGALASILKRVPVIEYYPPGSKELAEEVVRAFKDDPSIRVVALKAHGLVAAASTLREAYYLTDWAEDAAKLAFLVAIIGRL